MKRKLFKSMCLAMLLAAFAGCGTEKNSVLPQMDLPKAVLSIVLRKFLQTS